MVAYRINNEDLGKVFRVWEVTSNEMAAWGKIKRRLNLNKIPVTMCKLLGQGTQGRAFQINARTVMKVSYDTNCEPHVACVVKAFPSPYISRIYDVFGIDMYPSNSVFIIIQEKLEKCEESWGNIMDDVGGLKLTLKLVNRMEKYHTDPMKGKLSPKFDEQFKWLKGLATYFNEHKITYRDCHSGNLMRKKDKHKLIDLEYGKVSKKHQLAYPIL